MRLTDASIIDQHRWIAMGITDSAADINEVGEIGDVALIVVDMGI